MGSAGPMATRPAPEDAAHAFAPVIAADALDPYFDPSLMPVYAILAGVALLGILLVVAAGRASKRKVLAARMPPRPVQAPHASLKQELRNQELLQFLNNASHDLASPLTPIRLQLAILNQAGEEDLSEKQQRALRVVRRNIEQMGMLVEDLKEASRMQAGHFKLYKQPVRLDHIVLDAIESFGPAAEAAHIDLGPATVHDHVTVHADRKRLDQVLYNLLTNAIKFTPEDGSIRVGLEGQGATARVRVQDTGLGLEPEEAKRLFRPFSQAHGTAEKKQGSGLGLYIAKGIVEGHGGRIWVESDGPGTGCRFSFQLPVADAAALD